jgi:hypothetical protein
MKQRYSLLLIVFIFSILSVVIPSSRIHAGVGDTTVVQTFRYDTTMRAGVFQFPDDTSKTYEKIIMVYSMRCKNGLVSTSTNRNLGCGEWDYNCYTYIVDSTQVDSLFTTSNSHKISNTTDTVYEYTTIPVRNYYQYIQQEVTINSIISEDSAVVGTGTTAMDDPFNTSNPISRTQFLWKASELTSSGLSAGAITGMRMYIQSLGNTIRNLRIRIKATTQTSLNENSPETSGFTEVYFQDKSFSSTGKQQLNFYTPFNWNGTSNVLVDFSFTRTSGASGNDVRGDTTGYNSTLTTNQEDSYLNYSGTLSYIDINPSALDSISDKITVSFWAFGDSLRLPANTSIMEGVDNSNVRHLNIHLPWNDSKVYWDCGNDGTGYDRISLTATATEIKGRWNFWAFTKNASTGIMEVYLNGALVANGSGKTKMIDMKKMIVGMGINGTNFYPGSIDELSIWNKDLNQAAIQEIMFKDITNAHPSYTNLIAYYKMNDGSGTSVDDSSPNSFHSVAFNPAWGEHRGHTLFRNFSASDERPNATFLKGVYTTTIQNDTVLDSVYVSPASVIAYNLVNGNLNVIDTTFVWPSGYSYTYNSSGAKVDSVFVNAQDTIFVTKLSYYQKRPMRFELINFITPYGINLDLNGLNGKSWEFDVTDFAPLLKGARYMAMEDGKYQEDNDIKFVFIEGTPPRNVKSITQIWPNGTWVFPTYNDIYTNKYFEPRNVVLSSSASMFKIKSAISGHGQEGEFISRLHTIRLNNSFNFSRQVWTECAANPIYPQGGTWVYDRAGWCPGAAVDVKEFEITNNVTAGSTINLDYSLPFNSNPGSSTYRVNHQLVSYGSANFSLDAAVDYIKTPSKRTEFTRFNPVCNSPVIKIKNTGSTTLTSLVITYGRVNGVMSTYNWAGSLNFLDTVMVTLPAPDWFTSNVDAFVAIVSNPNGGVDQYSNNDTMYSEFNIPAVYPAQLVFELKTNNFGNQTAYTLKNSQGTSLITRTGLGNNIIYRDTVSLNTECYTVYLTDQGDDGLQWWANTQQGSGYFRIINPATGTVLKTFNPDFGDNIYEQFTVDISLPVKEAEVNSIRNLHIYPNPAGDLFYAEFSLPPYAKAKLKLVNLLGEVIKTETYLAKQPLEKVSMDISDVESGIYFVVIESGSQSMTQKLVVAK